MKQPFNIADLFFESAKKFPHKIAIIHNDEKITYTELENNIKKTAAYFLEKGIKKDDRVLVFVPMTIDLYRIVIALFHIGAIAVFLDEWVSIKRMEACCEVAKCNAFIGGFKVRVLGLFSPALKKIPIRLGMKYAVNDLLSDNKNSTDKSDTALITFTTGTTGVPKAAKRTHGFLYEQFNALVEKIAPIPGDISIPVLPIVLLIDLGAGCTSVIADYKPAKPGSMNAAKIIQQLNTHAVTRLAASPFFVTELAKHIVSNKLSVPSLKKIFTGGAAVFPTTAELYDTTFPNAMTEIVYGSTEAEPISAISVKQLLKEKISPDKGLKAGLPSPMAMVKIIAIKNAPVYCKDADEFQKILLPAGNIGEIIVSGPHVLQEYFNNDEALQRNKIFVGSTCWHRTGDSGYIGEEGMLYLTGRCSSLIHIGDKIFYPFIYENYFSAIDGIEMGAILKLNGHLVAVLEIKKAIIKKNIIGELERRKILVDEIKFIKKMPRDQRHNSRIDYKKLESIFR